MASSAMALKLGVSGFFLPTTHAQNRQKTNASTISARRAAFYAYLSSYGYFDYGQHPKAPNMNPMLG